MGSHNVLEVSLPHTTETGKLGNWVNWVIGLSSTDQKFSEKTVLDV